MGTVVARFLDLWLDAYDVPAVARFWGEALGMSTRAQDDGSVRLSGERAWDALWIRPASEHATQCAIHVDVTTDDIARFLTLGAQVADASSYPWVVMVGPEGSEICVFPPEGDVRRPVVDLVMDTPDPVVAARWWSEVLDTSYHASGDDDYAWVEPVPGAPFQSIVYARQDRPVARHACRLRPRVATHDMGALFARGAVRVEGAHPGEILLADPTGNEFFVQVTDLVVRPDDEE